MIELTLVSKTIPGVGTFGVLTQNGQQLAVTAERDWHNNRPNVSCIPAGVYQLRPHDSPSKGKCLALVNPELGVTIHGPSQRTHCLVHEANFPNEVKGCIGVGLSWHHARWGVANSVDALNQLLELVTEPAKLTIIRH